MQAVNTSLYWMWPEMDCKISLKADNVLIQLLQYMHDSRMCCVM